MMKFKKLLLLLTSTMIISLPTLTVVSCKTNKEWPILTKQEVNDKIYALLNSDHLDWTGPAIGDEGTYEWINATRLHRSELEFWLTTKITAIIVDELVKQIPNLYTLFPHFNLLAESGLVGDRIGNNGETDETILNALFSGNGSTTPVTLNVNVSWSFTNANSTEFPNLMVDKELIFENETRGGKWINLGDGKQGQIPYTREEIEQRFEQLSMFSKSPWQVHEYHNTNIFNGHWTKSEIEKLQPKENYSANSFFLSLNFQKNSNRQDALKNFVNDLSKMNTLVYDDFKFNDILEDYFFSISVLSLNPKNCILQLKDYPNKDYLKKIATSETEFNRYKNLLSNEYQKKVSELFSFDNVIYNYKRLFDDVSFDFKIKKYFSPDDFSLSTKQGKINSIIFAYNLDPASGEWTSKNFENGVLIVETTMNFLQKDQKNNLINSVSYSYDMPVFVQYL